MEVTNKVETTLDQIPQKEQNTQKEFKEQLIELEQEVKEMKKEKQIQIEKIKHLQRKCGKDPKKQKHKYKNLKQHNFGYSTHRFTPEQIEQYKIEGIVKTVDDYFWDHWYGQPEDFTVANEVEWHKFIDEKDFKPSDIYALHYIPQESEETTYKLLPFSPTTYPVYGPVHIPAVDFDEQYADELERHLRNPHHPGDQPMSVEHTIECMCDLWACAMRENTEFQPALRTFAKWIYDNDRGTLSLKPKFKHLNLVGLAMFYAGLNRLKIPTKSYTIVAHLHKRRTLPLSKQALKMDWQKPGGNYSKYWKLPECKFYYSETMAHMALVDSLAGMFGVAKGHDADKLNRTSIVAYMWNWYIKPRLEQPTCEDCENPFCRERGQCLVQSQYSNSFTSGLLDYAKTAMGSVAKTVADSIPDKVYEVMHKTAKTFDELGSMVTALSDRISVIVKPILKMLSLDEDKLNVFSIIDMLKYYIIHINTESQLIKGFCVYSILNCLGVQDRILEVAREWFSAPVVPQETTVEEQPTVDFDIMSSISDLFKGLLSTDPKVIAIPLTFMACVFFGCQYKGVAMTSISKDFVASMRQIGFIGMGITGATKVMEVLICAVKHVLEWFGKKFYNQVPDDEEKAAKLEQLVNEYCTWTKEVEIIAQSELTGKLISDTVYQQQIIKLFKQGLDFQEKKLRSELPQELCREFSGLWRRIREAHNAVIRAKSLANFRPTPFHVQFFGAPGIGKSTLIRSFVTQIQSKYYQNCDNVLYTIGNTEQFDGYIGQPICYKDDMFPANDYKDVMPLLTMISNAPLTLYMSHLEDKGRQFTSEWFLSTTNTPWPEFDGMFSHKAIWRRRHILCEVTIDPRVMDPVMGKFCGTLFAQHYPEQESSDFPHLRFSLYNATEPTKKLSARKLPPGLKIPTDDLKYDAFRKQVFSRYEESRKEEQSFEENRSYRFQHIQENLREIDEVYTSINGNTTSWNTVYQQNYDDGGRQTRPQMTERVQVHVSAEVHEVADEGEEVLEPEFTPDELQALITQCENMAIRELNHILDSSFNYDILILERDHIPLLKRIKTLWNTTESRDTQKIIDHLVYEYLQKSYVINNSAIPVYQIFRDWLKEADLEDESKQVICFVMYYMGRESLTTDECRTIEDTIGTDFTSNDIESFPSEKEERDKAYNRFVAKKTLMLDRLLADPEHPALALLDDVAIILQQGEMLTYAQLATAKLTISEHLGIEDESYNSEFKPFMDNLTQYAYATVNMAHWDRMTYEEERRERILAGRQRTYGQAPVPGAYTYFTSPSNHSEHGYKIQHNLAFGVRFYSPGPPQLSTYQGMFVLQPEVMDKYWIPYPGVRFTPQQLQDWFPNSPQDSTPYISHSFLKRLKLSGEDWYWEVKGWERLYKHDVVIPNSGIIKLDATSVANCTTWFQTSIQTFLEMPQYARKAMYIWHKRKATSLYVLADLYREAKQQAKSFFKETWDKLRGALSVVWRNIKWLVKPCIYGALFLIAVKVCTSVAKLFIPEPTSFKPSSIFANKASGIPKFTSADVAKKARDGVVCCYVNGGKFIGYKIFSRCLLIPWHVAAKIKGETQITICVAKEVSHSYWIVPDNIHYIDGTDLALITNYHFPDWGDRLKYVKTSAEFDIEKDTEAHIVVRQFNGEYETGVTTYQGHIVDKTVHFPTFPSRLLSRVGILEHNVRVGVSGAPIFTTTRGANHPTIHGFQSYRAGDHSYYTMVSREVLEKLCKEYTASYPINKGPIHLVEEEPTCSSLFDGHIDVVGSVPPEKIVYQPMRTEFSRTVLWSVVPEQRVPAILSAKDPKACGDPLRHSINKHGRGHIVDLNPTTLRLAVSGLAAYYKTKFDGVSVYTMEEALTGKGDLRHINLNSSPGLPWTYWRTDPGKHSFVNINPDGTLGYVDPLVEEMVCYTLNEFARLQIPPMTMMEIAKDELRPIGKAYGLSDQEVDDYYRAEIHPSLWPPDRLCKTRSITVLPLEYTIIYRMYFSPFFSQLYKLANAGYNSFCIGINTESTACSTAYWRARELNDGGYDFDVGNWDGHFTNQLSDAVVDLVNEVCADGNDNIRKCLVASAWCGHVQYKDAIYRKEMGNPSGFPGTGDFNTTAHIILAYYQWLTIMAEAGRHEMMTVESYLTNVLDLMYGDDRLLVISKNVEDTFQPSKIVELYEGHGWPITAANKTMDCTKKKPLEELQFLKRVFIFDVTDPFYVRWAMDKTTIMTLLSYVRRSNSPRKQFYENLTTALDFAADWGKEYFEEIKGLINTQLYRNKYRPLTIDYASMVQMKRARYFGIPSCPTTQLHEELMNSIINSNVVMPELDN